MAVYSPVQPTFPAVLMGMYGEVADFLSPFCAALRLQQLPCEADTLQPVRSTSPEARRRQGPFFTQHASAVMGRGNSRAGGWRQPVAP